ncbi:hemagglutinin repeat-containing protein [Paraburkholderia phosphatilytica]|uniref:hemagglutinin repeat-containing protein n=1 Tax=Paraburkholderia phosphatilytica TaxID=2282883 RepID=UPI000E5270AF|nr:hemagglutinin repeat-containing protein [Paraburkholderia phosphatilytica]
MNRNTFRLVYSRLREMWVAVGETAAAMGKSNCDVTRTVRVVSAALLTSAPAWCGAQIVPGGAYAPSVTQTANGLPQVNINRPSGAGVSMNTYGQFDVSNRGAILNNSPVVTQTQQAGYVNGNPNFGAGQSARVIVNQVHSAAASQINGYVEVAGPRAEVVIANGSGISVNGGGFINTSRAVLTTGTPNFAADGSLSGFNVTGGNITVQGAGFNAANVDQVDLLARAVQVNAAIYANRLNVVAGANSVDHDTLNATPIAGDGPAPTLAIDVGQLGGMYAGKIFLVSNEYGVGVSTRGVLAAQAGDLVLTAQGKLVLAGQTSASGDISASARDGIDSSGTTYAQQDLSLSTSGALTNSGTLAARQDTAIRADSVASTGTVGAGVDGDGAIGAAGNLSVTASGTLSANGHNMAGGNATLAGQSVNVAGSTTSARGSVSLDATGGDLDTSAAKVTAGGALDAHAAGAVHNAGGTLAGDSANVSAASIDNTRGTLGGNGNVTVSAKTLTNDAGASLVAGGLATLNITLTVSNAGGTLYGGTGFTLNQASASVINDGGSILGGIDASLFVGSLSNASGSIRANRDISAAGFLTGDGNVIAGRNLTLNLAGDYTNRAANTLHADGDMTLNVAGTLTNTGTLAASGALNASGMNVVNAAGADINSSSTTVNAAQTITNAGRIEGDTVRTNSTTLANTGTLTGNDVQVFATDITNTGAAAVIAGAQFVGLYASGSVTNADGALIYSAGNLEIARDNARDATGLLANQTGMLTNSAASIEADGDIDIAAHTVNNLRTGVVTEAGTPEVTGTATLTLWTAGLDDNGVFGNLGAYYSVLYPEWRWYAGALATATIGALMKPITVTVPKSQVTSLDVTTQSFSLTEPLTDSYGLTILEAMSQPHTRTITTNPTQYYQSIADNGDTYSITFWPDYDPAKQIRPDQVQVRTDLGNSNHDYVETSRTITTTTSTDQLVSAGTDATIQAQGAIRINADGGSIHNLSSTMAAGGDLVRRAADGTVNDTGTVLQQSVMQTAQSTFVWHQKSGSDSDTRTVDDGITQGTTTVDALPAIASSNQTVQTDAQTITIAGVNRQGQTVDGSGVAGSGTAGGAAGNIANLKLPVNGLYSYRTAPDAPYLVATDPRFTQYSKFISSDYMLGLLGLDPSKTIKRLGDGLYEETLIRNQVTQLTGRTFLAGYTDNLAEYTALMTSGAAYARTFGLEPGIALTPDQMRQLTTDMVWLVSQDVTLPDGSHQTVLVPQLYLAQSSTVDLTHSGALVAGNSVNLTASGDVNSSGHISSSLATTVIGNNVVNSGTIGSGGITAVAAAQDVRNIGGRIGGADVVVQAGRDIIIETRTGSVSKSFGADGLTGSVTATTVDAVGAISATGSVALAAGRDVNIHGATVQAGGDASIAAGRDVNVGTVVLTSTQDVQSHGGQDGGHTAITQNLGSTVTTGGNLVTVSGRDTTLTGAGVTAGGNAALIAGHDLTVTAAKDTQRHDERSLGDSRAKHTASSYDEAVRGSSVNAGVNVTLAAGQGGAGNLAVLGSTVTTGAAGTGAVSLVSTGDITVGSVSETHDSTSWEHTNHSGFMSKDTSTDSGHSHQVIANGSTISGDTVSGMAGHDMTISGSTVAATNDVSLAAANNLTVTTSQDSSNSSHFHQEVTTGIGSSGGIGVSYARIDTKDTTHDSSVTNNASLIGSTTGSVTLSAGADLHVTGSDIIAAQNVSGTGANVVIDAAVDTAHRDETQEVSKSGLTLAVKAPVLDAMSNAIDQTHAANHSQDDRAAALHGMAAASGAFDSVGAARETAAGLARGEKPSAKIELSYGSSHSSNTFAEDSTTNRGSSVTAGGTAAFVATGNGTPGSGNLTIAGSDVNANDVILAAGNQVNLINTTDTDTTRSANQSRSASVGVSFGTDGFGVSASMAKAHGDANSDAAMQNSTHINANGTATILSGGDTNIVGANVNGRQVNADVGGNLNIASVQDTLNSSAHQESAGGGFSISQGGGSASFSSQHGDASGSYAGVNEQAGIHAGDGGFNINVKGNTDLNGAVIASDADATKNNLSTGTLSFSDIQNQSVYDAHSGGFGGGFTTGNGGSNYATHGSTSGTNAGGPAPMLGQNDSGSDSAITRSGISAGSINVTDGAHQSQDVATLNRDMSDTNGAVAKLPDVSNLLDRQADMMAAAGAAGEAVSRRIGDFAALKYEQTHDPAWAEGGAARAAMQAAGAALVTGLAGGNVIGGAAGAGIASIAGGRLNQLSGAIADSDPTGDADVNKALGNIVANVIATGAGAVVGGDAGAFSGYNVDRFNRQFDADGKPVKKDLVAQACGAGAQCSDTTLNAAIQAQGVVAQQALGAMSPDYVSIQGNIYVASGGVVVNLQNGDVFGSWALGKPIPTYSLKPGISVTFGSILGGGGAQGTSSYLAGGGANASTFVPVPGFPVIGAGGGVSHAYGGQTSIEYGLSFPPGTAVNPVSYGFQLKR